MHKKTQPKPKTIPTELHGDRITIRQLKLSDAEAIFQIFQNRDATRWTLAVPNPYPKNEAVKYIRKTQRLWKANKGYGFGIILNATGQYIGGIGLKCVDLKHQCAEMGYGLDKKFWGRGLATEAVQLLLNFGFKNLKLHRIYACAFEANIASWRVMEKCGLTREGCWRQALIKHGRRQNMLHYGILKTEYQKIVKKTK